MEHNFATVSKPDASIDSTILAQFIKIEYTLLATGHLDGTISTRKDYQILKLTLELRIVIVETRGILPVLFKNSIDKNGREKQPSGLNGMTLEGTVSSDVPRFMKSHVSISFSFPHIVLAPKYLYMH